MPKETHLSRDVDWRPRLSINISAEQYRKLQKYIPWGTRTKVFSIIIDDLISAVEEKGTEVIGALIARRIKYEDISRWRDNVNLG